MGGVRFGGRGPKCILRGFCLNPTRRKESFRAFVATCRGGYICMTRDAVLDLFRKSGALLEGHFRLTSGLHSPGYMQCALVLQEPAYAESIGRALGDRARELQPTVVLS